MVGFADTFDLVIANMWFTNMGSQLVIFKSGSRESQSPDGYHEL